MKHIGFILNEKNVRVKRHMQPRIISTNNPHFFRFDVLFFQELAIK